MPAQKTALTPWQYQQGGSPAVSAEFVAGREDVVDLSAEPDDPRRPPVNFDEKRVQLIAEQRQPLPTQPGQVARYDYEYERHGTANLFVFCEPPAGWRQVGVSERRTLQDCAHQRKWLVAEQYPAAEGIRLGLAQLNPHKPASLDEAFAPAEARRIRRKREFPFTPKHGSWLNRAEIALSVLQRQGRARRLPEVATLARHLTAYEERRNSEQATLDWRFTAQEARIRLHRLYPSQPS